MKRKIRKFLREHRFSSLSSAQLISALREQGYTVLRFNRLCNDEDLDELIDALNVRPYIVSTRGFTYANADYRLVFLHEDLSEKEACMVLAHEQGHIACGHTEKQPILGEDVRQENEANEFAHLLLHPSPWQRIKMWARRHRVLSSVLAAVCVLLIIGGIVGALAWNREQEESRYAGEYYLTQSGNCYHTADCGFVKGKYNVRRMTREEYDSGIFAPCSRCLPEE